MHTHIQQAQRRTFYGVALALIVLGAGIFVVGAIQAILQTLSGWWFGWPFGKIMGGLIILGIGYIMLQLEIIRQQVVRSTESHSRDQ